MIQSEFYPVQQGVAHGRRLQSLFNSTDEKFHARLRRHLANAYAMSTLVNFEPLVDSTTVAFLEQLKERFTGEERSEPDCDFGLWLQYYSFDVIGELTYSRRLGFVDRGVDVDNIITDMESLMDYVSVVSSAVACTAIPQVIWQTVKKLTIQNI